MNYRIDYTSDERQISNIQMPDYLIHNFPGYKNPNYFINLESNATISIYQNNKASFCAHKFTGLIKKILKMCNVNNKNNNIHLYLSTYSYYFDSDNNSKLTLILLNKKDNSYEYVNVNISKIYKKNFLNIQKQTLQVNFIKYHFTVE